MTEISIFQLDVEIPLNPYQGLKLILVLGRILVASVEIPLNPYQGLKLRELVLQLWHRTLSKFLLIPIRD